VSPIARRQSGERIIAPDLDEESWRCLKRTYTVGELKMECCDSSAIPKTSPAGLQFFAHVGEECSSAPETMWHRQAKALVSATLNQMHIPCVEEYISPDDNWRADAFFMTETGELLLNCNTLTKPSTNIENDRAAMRNQESSVTGSCGGNGIFRS
jgi:hypothetical protein